MVYTFGGNNAESIYEFICKTLNDKEYIILNKGATVTSISIFDSVVFRVRINSKTQCLDSEDNIVLNYVDKIYGASVTNSTAHIPLLTTEESIDVIKDMLFEVYDYRRLQVRGNAFGCCNDHVRCSDAGYCLHLNEKEYWGCGYRKNLEAGRIFYGKNAKTNDKEVKQVKNRYIVFDIETPNARNDKICSIGIVVLEDKDIVQEYYSLIDPETYFDALNIKINGISQKDIKGHPNFKTIWNEIKDIMSSGLLIAHNAPFDMSVLAKTLKAYEIEWLPYVYYACTCSIGRALDIAVNNYKLNTLCDAFGIVLECHHNAISDAKACAVLLSEYINKGITPESYIRNYDFSNMHTVEEKHARKVSRDTERLLELKKLLTEEVADGVLSPMEVMLLEDWLMDNEDLKGQFPFDKIYETVEAATSDGKLDNEELQNLFELFERVTDPLAHMCHCDNFDIDGKTFCLSGDFEHGSKSEVEALLVEKGGILNERVTLKTDYLIVGEKGSARWSSGNYGSKVKKAMEIQEKGGKIQILKENDILL